MQRASFASSADVNRNAASPLLFDAAVTSAAAAPLMSHAPSPMALDVVTLSNNAIMDPEEVKAHATKDDPWAGEWMKRNIAGVGPYRLVKNEPGVEVVLESSKGYWRPEPYFQRIALKFVPNEVDPRIAVTTQH